MSRRPREPFAFAAAAALSLAAGCSAKLDSFFYDPLKADHYDLRTTVIPAFELLSVATPDGQKVSAAFVPSSGEHPDITLVYCHGQSNDLTTHRLGKPDLALGPGDGAGPVDGHGT